jgi:uncharacterized membrane protein (UPF0127 family)
MRLIIKSKKKKISLDVKECNFFQKLIGLMFQRRENAEALLFDFGKNTNVSLHSFFVFFPFFVVWLDDKNRIVEIKKAEPFRFNFSIDKPFNKILEIPISKKYSGLIKRLNLTKSPSTRKI